MLLLAGCCYLPGAVPSGSEPVGPDSAAIGSVSGTNEIEPIDRCTGVMSL